MVLGTRLPSYILGSRLLPQTQKALDTLAQGLEQLLVVVMADCGAQLHAVQNLKTDQGSSTLCLAVQVWSRPFTGGNRSTLFARSMTSSS